MRPEHASVEIYTDEDVQELLLPVRDAPFHILVAGDFAGGELRPKAFEIDRDSLDQVLGALAPSVQVQLGGNELAIHFRELEDFHPDRLYERLAPFQTLRNLRQRLSHASTFAAAAAEMCRPTANPPAPELANLSGADLLRMMTGGEEPAREKPPARSDWDRFIHDIVAPYATPRADPRQPELIAQTDAAIAGQMLAILHDPRFQALESAWRALDFLVRRLETGENLKISLLHLPHAVLVTEEGLAALRRALAEQAASVVAGFYYFSADEEPALLRLAALARGARAPLLAGLAPEVVGLNGVFTDLRRSPDACWVGLALPRFLLRLPYGHASNETDSFAFEEMPTPPRHEFHLWGHPAAACAFLLGETFLRHGWAMRPGAFDTIDGLPMHVYQAGGESELKPCAEVLLTEDAAALLLERGFMPLVSIKGTDTVRVPRFQSVSQQHATLAGRWTR